MTIVKMEIALNLDGTYTYTGQVTARESGETFSGSATAPTFEQCYDTLMEIVATWERTDG